MKCTFKQTIKQLSMKIKVHKSRFKLIVLGIMATVLIAGCNKEKEVIKTTPKPNVEETNSVSINVLITYYANLIKADEKYVTYDEKADQFLFYGTPQNLTRKKLTEIYLTNTNPATIQ